MPLYRIRGSISFDKDEHGESTHYQDQTLDAEARGATTDEAVTEMREHLNAQGISNVVFTDGPRFFTWYEHELGQGWQEATNG